MRRCLLEVALVPVSARSHSFSLYLSLCLSSPSFRAQWCCQRDDLCKSAAKPPRANCASVSYVCAGSMCVLDGAVLYSQHMS